MNRWRGEGGYRELLKVALPLIASTGMWSVQTVIDRAFLAHYSNADVAGSMNGGSVHFTVIVLFVATVAYANTFVAQYIGAGRPGRVGLAVWQAVFFSLAAGVVLFALARPASGVFVLFGHEPSLVEAETGYFLILTCGAVFPILGTALSTFFSGRADTVTVMLVTLASVAVNVVLDYALIFGRFGLPELGVRGAAWATVIAYAVYSLLFLVLMLRPAHRRAFGTLSGCRFDAELMRRMFRYGLPSGVSYILEVAVWAATILLMGTYGVVASAASAIAFGINSLAFMPVVGVGLAVSTLVGRRQGEGRPELSARTAWSAVHLVVVAMGCFSVLMVLAPGPLIGLFSQNGAGQDPGAVPRLVRDLLYYVAIYVAFDAIAIVLFAALRGAGDTLFPMYAAIGLSW
ncbi:MAG TPA: MATE family efflux transporter, partial [Vicinamibacterales bacterium]|nr:MATE family efflux transporter [Vicinamibacterales bacterium]